MGHEGGKRNGDDGKVIKCGGRGCCVDVNVSAL